MQVIPTRKVVILQKQINSSSGALENLFSQLPTEISATLRKNFIQAERDRLLVDYFQKNSEISGILMENPASFAMLEAIYKKKTSGAIDGYFQNSLSGLALHNRLHAVKNHTERLIKNLLKKQATVKVLNLGCGTARDTIEMLARNKNFKGRVLVDCIDIDHEAIEEGKRIAGSLGVEVNFIEENIFNLKYDHEADICLLIGVLCGLTLHRCIAVLKRTKPYLKTGGALIASNVMSTMQEDDPFMPYILEHIIGWKLVYKTIDQLHEIFSRAGYDWKGQYYDEPYRFHGMGIGSAK